MAFRASIRDDERRTSTFRTRYGSYDDVSGTSPMADKAARRKSKVVRNEPFSPDLRPKTSLVDLMFNMEGDDEPGGVSPSSPSLRRTNVRDDHDLDQLPSLSAPERGLSGYGSLGAAEDVPEFPILASSPASPTSVSTNGISSKNTVATNPWGASNLPISRLNLRETLAESKPAQSALSAGLAAQSRDLSSKPASQKLSQKERKKQLQQQAEQAARLEAEAKQQSQKPWSEVADKRDAPWKKLPKAEHPATVSGLLHPDSALLSGSPSPKPSAAPEASSGKARRAASPDTRFSGQKSSSTSKKPPPSPRPDPQPVTPHSKSYIKRAPKAEQEIGLPLADIIGQQQREQQTRREAVAKRSLQEIQQEQEFQEWWDQESRRTQEEEARRLAREGNKDNKKRDGGGRRGRGGGGNKSKDAGAGNNKKGGAAASAATTEASASSSKGKGRAHRGKA